MWSIVCLVLNTASSINREKAFIVSSFLTIHTDFPKWWALKFSSWEGLYYLCVDTNFINIYLCMWPQRNTVTLKILNDLITDEKPTHRINRLPSMGSYSASVSSRCLHWTRNHNIWTNYVILGKCWMRRNKTNFVKLLRQILNHYILLKHQVVSFLVKGVHM